MDQRVRARALPRSARGEIRHWKVPGLSHLRIGGSIGKAAEGIKKVIPSTGALVGGAALGGLGSVIGSKVSGVNPVDDLKKGAALTPLALAGTSTFGGSSGSGAAGAAGSAGGDVAGNDDPSSDNTGALDPATEAQVAAAPGGKELVDKFKQGLATLSDVLEFAKKYVPVAVDVLAAKAAHDRQAQSDKYATLGLAAAQKTYDQNAPLRDAGRSGMLSAGAYKPDLSKLQSVADQGGTGKAFSPLPMAGAPASGPPTPPQGHVLPIANGPTPPALSPSGIGSRMPVPPTSQFGSQFQGPASQAPQPPPGAPSGMVPGIGAGGPLVPKPTLPIAAGPPQAPVVNRKPGSMMLPFAQPVQ